ncbi:MAG: 2Fe-2S iron-sulfur cluster binding domain-containing protein [Nevskia sp.]|nr:2Fe-2S iron-sulfur cluster binding domain-containing protein [Nevskia sp.]
MTIGTKTLRPVRSSTPASVRIALLAAAALLALPVYAQTADEHAAHHPPPDAAAAGASMGATTAPAGPAAAPMGGMDMGSMMKQMGAPAAKELYPSLMELPDLPLEKRAEVQQRAHQRMTAGTDIMSASLGDLSTAAGRDDYTAMQDATQRLREGLAQFESGLAAHRALAEGAAPRSVAMQWFKRDMNLLPRFPAEQAHGFFGLSAFHYFTMLMLAAFALTLVAIYFARMRRVSSLLAQIKSGGKLVAVPPAAVPTAVSSSEPAATSSAPRAVATTTGSWSGQLRVARIFQETADVKTFRLAPMSGTELPFVFEPGQFLTVGVIVDGKVLKRSYSIASSPCCHGWCEITVKHARGGAVSGHLHEQVKVGDLLDASGPYGRFTFRGQEAPSVVLIAGGVGVTPLMSAIRYLTDQSWTGEIFLFYACARLDAVIFREELDYLVKRHPNLHLTLVLNEEPSAEWSGERGFVTSDLLARTVPDLTSRRVHLCGPPPMMEAVRKALTEAGLPPEQVKSELFLTPEVKHPATPAAEPPAAAATCSFARSGKKGTLPPDLTVLDVAEATGVVIDSSCRQGFCGTCKVKLLDGQVTMAVEDGLTPADKAAGLILACQAKAQHDVTVDA